MEKVVVEICRREYIFKTDDSADKIKELADRLEKMIIMISKD